MDDALTLEGPQILPWPFADRSVGRLTLRRCIDTAASADLAFLLYEARRTLRPGGTLCLVLAAEQDAAPIARLAERLGLRAATPAAAAREACGEGALELRKPDRRAQVDPSVTLAIPAYSPRFFEQSLASAIGQTHANLEILVCDDSGGTEIEAITRRLGRTRSVVYERNPVRLGGRGNYAKCFTMASGEFIKYLNDDDLLAPDCVQRLVDAFRLAPDIVLATSYRRCIDEHGNARPDQPATRPLVERDATINGITLANAMLMSGINAVGEPTTTLFRKTDLQQSMPDDFRFESPDCMGVVDMAMWSPLLLKGDAVCVRDPLSAFRIHGGQLQNDPAMRESSMRSIRNLQSRWLALGLHARLRRDMVLTRPFPDGGATTWEPRTFAPLAPVSVVPRWWT